MRVPADFLAAAEAFADVGSAMLRSAAQTRSVGESKPDRTFVTATDRAIEERLREMIADRFPDHGIWGEEFGRCQPDAEWQWIIDPVDGTAQFIAGIPVYATLVALAYQGAPVVGIMDFPAVQERWVGCAGRPTLRNGQVCRTSGQRDLASAMMAISSPDFFDESERPVFTAFQTAARWRVYGGAALGYGQLAAGRIDLCCDARFQIYDYACYRPIIEGAGGVVTDWEGAPLAIGSGMRVLAAASNELHEQALRRLHAAL